MVNIYAISPEAFDEAHILDEDLDDMLDRLGRHGPWLPYPTVKHVEQRGVEGLCNRCDKPQDRPGRQICKACHDFEVTRYRRIAVRNARKRAAEERAREKRFEQRRPAFVERPSPPPPVLVDYHQNQARMYQLRVSRYWLAHWEVQPDSEQQRLEVQQWRADVEAFEQLLGIKT